MLISDKVVCIVYIYGFIWFTKYRKDIDEIIVGEISLFST